jgi:hypothetical protein
MLLSLLRDSIRSATSLVWKIRKDLLGCSFVTSSDAVVTLPLDDFQRQPSLQDGVGQ